MKLKATTSLCAAAMTTISLPAWAQSSDAAPVAAEQASNGLGDIVVTAEKRETVARRTPIAMDVFTPEKLAENGITNIAGLQNIAPTLQFALSGADTLVGLRGVSSRDYTEIGDPTIAISIDNFYLQRSVALNASMFDVERVEVLRGPQGTLYGRNATGGAINISSVKPVLGVFKGFGAIEYGNYNTVRGEGAVNVPVTNNIAVRASFMRSSHDGYSKIAGEKDGDDDDTTAARLRVLYKPVDRMKILLTGEYTKLGGVGPIAYGQAYDYDTSGNIDHGDVDIKSRKSWDLNTQGSISTVTHSIRGEIDYDLDFMTVSYFGGYRKMRYSRKNDIDGTAGDTNSGHLTYPQNENEGTQNHELRLTSTGSGPLTWQAGLYYFRERNDLYSEYGYDNVVPFDPSYIFSYHVGANSKAAFAQAGYKVLENLKLEAGIRYSQDEKFRTGYQLASGAITDDDYYVKNSKVTWHASATYEPTATNMLYAKFDTGYKSGGFTSVTTYGPETLIAYEVGSKNRFVDNHVELNLGALYYDYTDIQVNQYREDGLSAITNAGKARIWGIESEAAIMPSDDTRINLTVNYLNAKYIDFETASGGVNVSYSGNTMIQAPRWSITGGIQQRFKLGGGVLTARLQSKFQTRSYFSYRNYDSESEKSFTKTDFTLEYAPRDPDITLMFYMRNIENKRIMLAASEYGAAKVYRFQFAEPRTIGARLTYRF